MIKMCDADWLLADIQFELDNVPIEILRRSLVRAIKEFSRVGTNKQWIKIPTQTNVQHYPFERHLPEGWDVQYMHDVKYNDCCIPCLNEDCDDHCTSGYTQDDMSQITLKGYCPQNDDDECHDTLEIQVTLRLSDDTCKFPCDVIEQFSEDLQVGVKAKVMAMNNKPWTSLREAEFYENKWEGCIASAKCLVGNKMNPKGHEMKPERVI